MKSCRECCYAALTGANLYCSINDCYVGELTCDDFEPIVKAKTNADRIRSMTDEELAEWIISITEDLTPNWLDWLKQEAKE